jgi:hypothetical protein
MKPNTSSSPFRPTFVQYITGRRDDQIADFHATMANIPYLSSYSLDALAKMIEVLVPKKTTTLAIEKLRIVVLFHAFLNMSNRRVVGDMVAHSEKLHHIPWEAYGSRKRYGSIECAAKKVFTTIIARQEDPSTALCSKDANSCYHRILHTVATICVGGVGVHEQTCLLMLCTLAKIKRHIWTT